MEQEQNSGLPFIPPWLRELAVQNQIEFGSEEFWLLLAKANARFEEEFGNRKQIRLFDPED